MNRKSIASPKDCILVTGSNGFIGSKVVEKLLEYGFANFVALFDLRVNLIV